MTESGEGAPRTQGGSRLRAIRPWLSTVAVLLAALAVALAFLMPRPVMAHASRGGLFPIGTTCTHYPEAEVSLNAPGRGTVVVSATVGVGVNHSFGTRDEVRVVLAASSGECTLDNYTAFVSIPATLPTEPYHFETVPLLRPFPVSADRYTFYVNGIMFVGGGGGDRFDSASLVAVFYPA